MYYLAAFKAISTLYTSPLLTQYLPVPDFVEPTSHTLPNYLARLKFVSLHLVTLRPEWQRITDPSSRVPGSDDFTWKICSFKN